MSKKAIDATEFPTFSEMPSSLPYEISLLDYVWNSVQEDHQKLLALCEIFEIPNGESQFYQLSLALARKFLSPPKPRGSKKKWTKGDFARLVIEVEALETGRGHSKSWAYEQLTKKEPYKTLLKLKSPNKKSKTPADTLKTHYNKHKDDPFVTQVKRIIQEQSLDVPVNKSS
jgi:hypothetical protein